MNRIPLSLSAAVLLATTVPARAWPFIHQDGTGDSCYNSELGTAIAFQADGDPELEIFPGGRQMANLTFGPNGSRVLTRTDLPLPDTDPYPASNPSVGFSNGCGDVGDVDGDGDMDIVYTAAVTYDGSVEPNNVRAVVCRNNGNGTWTRLYQMKQTSAPMEEEPRAKLADLDGDGDLDMVLTHDGIRVYWNNGAGDFPSATTIFSNLYRWWQPELVTGDFNGDGRIDLIVMHYLAAAQAVPLPPRRITMLVNQGGTFAEVTVLGNTSSSLHSRIKAADMDGDGDLDLLNTQSDDANWQIYLRYNNGDGTFGTPSQLHETDNFWTDVIPADLDRDGVMDIVFSPSPREAFWMRRNLFGGYTLQPQPIFSAPGSGTFQTCVGDLDADGDPDVALLSGLYVAGNDTPVAPAAASSALYAGPDAPSGTVHLTAADVNGDGREDLIASDGAGQRIRWYAGNGNGISTSTPLLISGQTPAGVAAGDFNRDGHMDLAWSTTSGTLRRALNTDGSGINWTHETLATMGGITRIKAADMEGDGDLDILSVSPSQSLIRWHVNNGTSTWSPFNVATGLAGVSTFDCGQLIPGGRPEVVSLYGDASLDYAGLHIWSGSAWTQTNLHTTSHGTASRAVTVTNISRNNNIPEAVFSNGQNTLRYGEGSGSSFPLLSTDITAPVQHLASTDWNRDGHVDLLVATSSGLRLHQSGQSPHAAAMPPYLDFLTGVSVQSVAVLDFNGDSWPDAVAADTSGKLHLVTNRTAPLHLTTTASGTRAIVPGSSGEITSTTVTSQFVTPGDFVPQTFDVHLRHAVLSGGVDTPGGLLLNSEFTPLVESLSIMDGSTVIASYDPLPAAAAASFSLTAPIAAQNALAMPMGQTRTYQLRLKLKSTAASAPVTRFFAELRPSSKWSAIHQGVPSPTPARLSGTATSAATLVTLKTPGALDTWRLNNFSTYDATGSASNDADPDGDGIPNLMEYVTSQDPKIRGGLGSAIPLEVTFTNRQTPVQANLRLLTSYDSKVRLTIQYSTSLQTWSTLSTRTGTGAWSVAPDSSSLLSGGGRTWFKFSASSTPQNTAKQYFRLKAEELP